MQIPLPSRMHTLVLQLVLLIAVLQVVPFVNLHLQGERQLTWAAGPSVDERFAP